MRKLTAKIRSRKGETLIEILVSILIVSLSALLVASMFVAAGRINLSVRKMDEDFYHSVTEVESQTGTPQADEVNFQIKEDGFVVENGSIAVNVYTDENETFSGYSQKEE